MQRPADFFVRKYPTKPGTCFVLAPPLGEPARGVRLTLQRWADAVDLSMEGVGDLDGRRPVLADLWTSIQAAEIVIADLTSRSPLVLYGLGLCHSLWKKVLLLAQHIDDVPADLRGAEVILYDLSEPGKARLLDVLTRTVPRMRELPWREGRIVPFEQPSDKASYARVEGQVVAVTAEEALIRLPDGREAVLRPEDYSWTEKVRDLSRKYQVGDAAKGVLTSTDDRALAAFSVKHQWPDPWPAFEQEFPLGKVTVGRVVSLTPHGAFVEVKPRFNGLIPRAEIASSDVQQGDRVRIAIRAIEPAQRNILLTYKGPAGEADAPPSRPGLPTVGTQGLPATGEVLSGEVRRSRHDYLLVQLEGKRRGICHITFFGEASGVELERDYPAGYRGKWRVRFADPASGRIEIEAAGSQSAS